MEYERNTRIKETPRILFCLNCKREGHGASKCPYSRCYWCYGKRHITKNCPYGPIRSCNNCKKVGNINYHENEKYFCQNCYSKIITNKKLIKGTKAQEVFTYQRDLIYKMFKMIFREKGETYQERLKNCSRFMRVNHSIWEIVIETWKREKLRIENYYKNKKENDVPSTYDTLAKNLGYTEIRCETCKNFRGSNNWNMKHYYSYAKENDYAPIMYDYRKDTAWFKRYTKEQRKEIEKEDDKQKEKQEKNEIKVKCLCWRKGTGNCPKHNHEVIWKENECLNCKKNNEKRNNYEDQDNKEKHHEEKPIVKEAYFWDDKVVEYKEAYLKWNLVTNTNIAMGNYVNNEIDRKST